PCGRLPGPGRRSSEASRSQERPSRPDPDRALPAPSHARARTAACDGIALQPASVEGGPMERSPIETSIAPWLAVPDGAAAVEFYGNAFGAEETYRLDGEEGRIAVARLGIGAAELWVQEDRDSDTSANGSIR